MGHTHCIHTSVLDFSWTEIPDGCHSTIMISLDMARVIIMRYLLIPQQQRQKSLSNPTFGIVFPQLPNIAVRVPRPVKTAQYHCQNVCITGFSLPFDDMCHEIMKSNYAD